jgi:hypothetical protein
VLVHRLPGGVEIPNLVDDVDVVSVAEDARDALASEIAVVCDEYAYRHRTPLSAGRRLFRRICVVSAACRAA